MNKEEILQLFYKDKDYSKIKELLKNSNESWSFNMLGDIAIIDIEPEKAFEYYNKAENIFGCAYCKFLEGELEEALIFATLIRNSSPAADWLYSIINILQNNLTYFPTYFQIRNFYEQDLEMLLLQNTKALWFQFQKKKKPSQKSSAIPCCATCRSIWKRRMISTDMPRKSHS